mmetsp:Transcript_7955/g.19339  ORF Transcript_7955/g.19339 Transcript_7955/m.19339 type:complete len:239 (-) Transcript_7955:8-724(-)
MFASAAFLLHARALCPSDLMSPTMPSPYMASSTYTRPAAGAATLGATACCALAAFAACAASICGRARVARVPCMGNSFVIFPSAASSPLMSAIALAAALRSPWGRFFGTCASRERSSFRACFINPRSFASLAFMPWASSYPKRPPVGRMSSIPAHAWFGACQMPLTVVLSTAFCITLRACFVLHPFTPQSASCPSATRDWKDASWTAMSATPRRSVAATRPVMRIAIVRRGTMAAFRF